MIGTETLPFDDASVARHALSQLGERRNMSLSALNPIQFAEICSGYWLNDILPDFVLTIR